MSKKLLSKKQKTEQFKAPQESYSAIKDDLFDEFLKVNSNYSKNQLLHYHTFHNQFQQHILHPYYSFSWWYKVLKWMRFHVTATVIFFVIIVLVSIIVIAQALAPQSFKPSTVFKPLPSQLPSTNSQIGTALNTFTECTAMGGSLDIENSYLICSFQGVSFKGPAVDTLDNNNVKQNSSVDELTR